MAAKTIRLATAQLEAVAAGRGETATECVARSITASGGRPVRVRFTLETRRWLGRVARANGTTPEGVVGYLRSLSRQRVRKHLDLTATEGGAA